MRDGASIMALDVATACGIAEGPLGGRPTCATFSFNSEGGDHFAVGEKALQFFADRLTLTPPALVIIERPGLHSVAKGRSTLDTFFRLYGLAFLAGTAARCRGVLRITVADAGEARKHFIGISSLPGDIGKRLVQARCRDLGFEFKTPDEADAIALWSMACEQVQPGAGYPIARDLSAAMVRTLSQGQEEARSRRAAKRTKTSAAAQLFKGTAKAGRRA